MSKVDPRIARSMERRDKAVEAFERWYAKMARAVAGMAKAKKAMKAADRAIDRVMQEQRDADRAEAERAEAEADGFDPTDD